MSLHIDQAGQEPRDSAPVTPAKDQHPSALAATQRWLERLEAAVAEVEHHAPLLEGAVAKRDDAIRTLHERGLSYGELAGPAKLSRARVEQIATRRPKNPNRSR